MFFWGKIKKGIGHAGALSDMSDVVYSSIVLCFNWNAMMPSSPYAT